MMHVVGADHAACELLQQIGFFVRAARRVQKGQCIRTVLLADFLYARGDEAERFVPGYFFKFAVLPEEWSFEPVRRAGNLMPVPSAQTDSPRIGGVRDAGISANHLIACGLHVQSASDPAERAGS